MTLVSVIWSPDCVCRMSHTYNMYGYRNIILCVTYMEMKIIYENFPCGLDEKYICCIQLLLLHENWVEWRNTVGNNERSYTHTRNGNGKNCPVTKVCDGKLQVDDIFRRVNPTFLGHAACTVVSLHATLSGKLCRLYENNEIFGVILYLWGKITIPELRTSILCIQEYARLAYHNGIYFVGCSQTIS